MVAEKKSRTRLFKSRGWVAVIKVHMIQKVHIFIFLKRSRNIMKIDNCFSLKRESVDEDLVEMELKN